MRRLVLLAAVAVVLIPTTTALADVISRWGYLFDNGRLCATLSSEISHGPYDGGFAKSQTVSKRYLGSPASCSAARDMVPYTMANKNVLLKKKAKGTWYVCVFGSLKYNKVTTYLQSKKSVYRTPCGRGMYNNKAGGWVNYGEHWIGGYLRSGGHYLPT